MVLDGSHLSQEQPTVATTLDGEYVRHEYLPCVAGREGGESGFNHGGRRVVHHSRIGFAAFTEGSSVDEEDCGGHSAIADGCTSEESVADRGVSNRSATIVLG